MALLNLLTNENALADFNPLTSSAISNKRLSPRLKKENVLKTLLEAVEETPAPSLNEMAERLGYSKPCTLRRYFPQTCDQITANYLKCSQGKRRGGWSTTRLQSNEAMLAALEAALEEESPPSMEQVARSLGYVSSQSLRPQFPEICKALSEKRRKIVSERRGKVEGELRQAIKIDPPVSLNAIGEKLGYKGTATLRTMFPNECREICLRYEGHIRKQFLSKVESALQPILIETPPPPLNASLQRIGVSDGFLRKHFPTQHRAIAARYIEFRGQQSRKMKDFERKKIKEIVSDLIKREIFPSMDTVLELLPNAYLNYPEVWATIQQARKELVHKA